LQSLSGPITSSGCASPDLVEGLFQTRQPTQYCEWRNGVNGRDAVCYCGTNECNAKEMLENWIENGGGCKLFLNLLLYLETRKSLKDQKSYDKYRAYYLLVKKQGQIKDVQSLRKF
jgi:hypothetical protein